jgi:hypothetical protein
MDSHSLSILAARSEVGPCRIVIPRIAFLNMISRSEWVRAGSRYVLGFREVAGEDLHDLCPVFSAINHPPSFKTQPTCA